MKFPILFILFFLNLLLKAQPPQIQWQKTYGGSEDDFGNSISKTIDGNYIIAGSTYSNNGDVSNFIGAVDAWLIKIDSLGNMLWNKTKGGTLNDYANRIIQTKDSGFAIIGTTRSHDFDVSGVHVDSLFPQYHNDIWLVKTDSALTIQWQRCLGGTDFDYGKDVIETSDDNFIIAAEVWSNDGDVTGFNGHHDFWLAKVNANGNMLWGKTYGGLDYEQAESCTQTSDGNYILAGGGTYNFGGSHGAGDAAIVKTDTGGNIIWSKCYGSTLGDYGWSIISSNNSTFYLVGEVNANDGDVSTFYGALDFWIMKGDSSGNILWENSFGGSIYERPSQIIQASDGGLVIVGTTSSNDGLVSFNNGFEDVWVIKLDSMGNLEWEKSLGGTDEEHGHSIIETSDGGYIVCGYAKSNDGDVSGNHGKKDVWVVKLSPPGLSVPEKEDEVMDLSILIGNDSRILRFFSKKLFNTILIIFDMNGKEVLRKNILVNTGVNYHTINISSYSSGMYFFNLYAINKMVNGKFIVE